MSTELVACEFEDSQNYFWDAQLQGNGIGESFIDIEGETLYIEAPVIVDPVPGELVSTGAGDLVVALLVGLALAVTAVVVYIKDRKNK